MEADEQSNVGAWSQLQHVLVDEDEVVECYEADDADEVRVENSATVHLDYTQLPS